MREPSDQRGYRAVKRNIPRLTLPLLLLTISLYSVPAQIGSVEAALQPEQAPVVDFSWRPRFIIVGEVVNFTTTVTGGTPPYSFSWDFDDSQNGTGQSILHTFTAPSTYLVSLNVTDSANESTVAVKSVVVQEWPISRYGWNIKWNITSPNGAGYTDGINVWDVTYQGTPVIRDARIAHVVVSYRNNLCGPYWDHPILSAMQAVKADGKIYYEESPGADPYFQLRSKYEVGGYNYTQVFRFYQSGRWEPELLVGRGGCAIDHTYEPQIRIDLAVVDDANDFASVYTPQGTWQNLLWEGVHTDNGFKDQSHNGAQWRVGDQRRYYYLVPKTVRQDTDLPELPSKILLVRARTGEIESVSCSLTSCGATTQFVNGEMAFRRNIAIWFTPTFWDHGPISSAPNKSVTLSFYPYGD